VHWRTLISAVLILLLLPLSSLAAVCGVNCRTRGMPDMPMDSAALHTNNASGSATQHHHETKPASDPDVMSIAAVSHQVSSCHACCTGLLPTLTSPCVRSQNSALQEQAIVSNYGRNAVIVRSQVLDLFVFREDLSRDSISPASTPQVHSYSLTLRI
jgi:hypothetical protein